jgi:hypothetical protein
LERPGQSSHGHGSLLLPSSTLVVGLTAARPLPDPRVDTPLKNGEAIRHFTREIILGHGGDPRAVVAALVVAPIMGPLIGAAVGIDAEIHDTAGRSIRSVLAEEQLRAKLVELCDAHLESLGVTLVQLTDAIPAEPNYRATRPSNHPLERHPIDLVVGYWFSSIVLIGSNPDHDESNSPLRLSLSVEFSTVNPHDGSSAGGITVVYNSDSRHKFLDWAKDDAAVLRKEMNHFWLVLDQNIAARIQLAKR